MWGFFGKRANQRLQPAAAKACRTTWRYVHPPEGMAYAKEADTLRFSEWALTVGEIDVDAIIRRVLISLYAEFCETQKVRPMSWGRFDRSLKSAGFERYRSSGPGRPWLYRLIRPASAIVYKLPPRQAPMRRATA
jgi:hypothetical protein